MTFSWREPFVVMTTMSIKRVLCRVSLTCMILSPVRSFPLFCFVTTIKETPTKRLWECMSHRLILLQFSLGQIHIWIILPSLFWHVTPFSGGMSVSTCDWRRICIDSFPRHLLFSCFHFPYSFFLLKSHEREHCTQNREWKEPSLII